MKIALTILLVALAMPARAENPVREKPVTTTLFVAAQTVLVLDMLQTFSIAKQRCPWGPEYCQIRPGPHEMNPLLGQHPSQALIFGYFTGIILAQTAIYMWGPDWLSPSTSVATLALEIPVVVNNFKGGFYLTTPF
jgi:hypothetical protein